LRDVVSSLPAPLALVTPPVVVVVLGVLPLLTGAFGPAALPFLAVQAVPLLWRDRAPRTVLTVTALGGLAQLAVGPGPSNANLGQWFAAAALVRVMPWPSSVLPPALLVVLHAVVILPPDGADLGALFIAVASAVVAWAYGDALARRGALREGAERDVRRREESADLRARAEALAQRVRIGEELHQLVGGALDTVVVQVRAARLTPLASATFARLLGEVEAVGRRALTEMDRFLGLLRATDDDAITAEAPPQDLGAPARAPLRTTPAVRALVAVAPPVLLLVLALWELSDRGGLTGLLAAFACLQLLPLVLRDLAPQSVLVVCAAAVAAQLVLGEPVANGVMGLPLAAYAVAAHGAAGRAVVWTSLVVGTVTVLAARLGVGYALQFTTVVAVFCAGAVYAGAAARAATEDRLAVRERLARADRDVRLRIRAAVAAERLALARELHDSVGHTLSLVVVQAGAARRASRTDPAGTLGALDAIERAALAALSEMDRAPAGDGAAGPQVVGLADLPALVDDVRRAGVAVRLRVEGRTDDLPAAMQSTVYRIVQEALTNVVKHAGRVSAVVTLERRAQVLALAVTNELVPGRVPTPRSSGRRGLPGMAERAALFRGRFEAGPTPSGFAVRVELPVPDPEEVTPLRAPA
jgi:signal transduction histidine kinase